MDPGVILVVPALVVLIVAINQLTRTLQRESSRDQVLLAEIRDKLGQ